MPLSLNKIMKNLFTLLLFAITSFTIQAQLNCEFDNPSSFSCQNLSIDTLSNPNNIWQIGPPQKVELNSAYSVPNVIITDTISPYPTNDTSYFEIKYPAQGGFEYGHTAEIDFYYWVDSDTLNDYGTIEFSPDNGQTWVNLVTDTAFMDSNDWYTSTPPTLTGNSNGWIYSRCNTVHLGDEFDIQPGDIVIYRFGFISDGTSDTLGGLMYDNINVYDYVENLPNHAKSAFESTSFPNPANDEVTIVFSNPNANEMTCKIYDQTGKEFIATKPTYESEIQIDLSGFSAGNYHYVLKRSNGQISSGKIVKK